MLFLFLISDNIWILFWASLTITNLNDNLGNSDKTVHIGDRTNNRQSEKCQNSAVVSFD